MMSLCLMVVGVSRGTTSHTPVTPCGPILLTAPQKPNLAQGVHRTSDGRSRRTPARPQEIALASDIGPRAPSCDRARGG